MALGETNLRLNGVSVHNDALDIGQLGIVLPNKRVVVH